ncbi:hypothetical protein GUJ93_ZPchr0002g23761 [Zizania palustris]|uniref:Uncharacterized protein n=1 Tax=Zizania palustris TaxID=103762 RepID=A0A8J5RG28_ZIZPA|nr:hypothetical protein GUJ93_ZPchr0002g23761 [Zizania palustris]
MVVQVQASANENGGLLLATCTLPPYKLGYGRSIRLTWFLGISPLPYMIAKAVKDLNLAFSLDLVMIGCWSLWLRRNRHIFNEQPVSSSAWKEVFLVQLSN